MIDNIDYSVHEVKTYRIRKLSVELGATTLTFKHLHFTFLVYAALFFPSYIAYSHCPLVDKYTSIKIQQKLSICDV